MTRPLRRRLVVLLIAVAAVSAGCGSSTSSSSPKAPSSPTVSAAALQERFVAVVRQIQPEVAQIQTNRGLGSGVVLNDQGDIVTNAHVTEGAAALVVTLADGRRFPARLVGAYVPDDLAVVTIGSGRRVTPARFGDSSKLAVGQIVLAAGNPLGLQSSITDGIISALGRSVSESGGVVLPNVIQTSAPINPGNSGGALVDLQGQVVGVPTLAAANPQLGTSAAGIGFAIPSNTVTDIAGQIVRYGRVVNSHRAALGGTFADSPDRPGALVVELQQTGPASRAGVKLGDLIQAINGRAVSDAEGLAAVLAGHRPGETVNVQVRSEDGSTRSIEVRLGELQGG